MRRDLVFVSLVKFDPDHFQKNTSKDTTDLSFRFLRFDCLFERQTSWRTSLPKQHSPAVNTPSDECHLAVVLSLAGIYPSRAQSLAGLVNERPTKQN